MRKNTYITKIFSFLLALSMVFAISGCKQETADPTEAPTEATNTQLASVPTEKDGAVKPTEEAKPTEAAKPTTSTEDVKADPTQTTEKAEAPAEAEQDNTPAATEAIQDNSGSSAENTGSGSTGETEAPYTPPVVADPTPVVTEPPHQHSYSSNVVAPGCTSNGYTQYTCTCGSSYTDSETSATGHSWSGWTVTTEAAVGVEGTETRTCGTCGATESQSIPALPAEVIDIWALEQYGRDYGVSLGYVADTSMGKGNSGYFPGCSAWFTTMAEGYSEVAESVDATTANLIALDGAIWGVENGIEWHARINVQVDDCGDGKYVIWVFYG